MSIQGSINQMLATVGAFSAIGKKAGSAGVSRESAMQKMKTKGKDMHEQRKTRRVFMDYLKTQKTNLGSTVGQLPPALQKQIASTYTKSQRRKMMDAIDAQRKEKKKV